MVEEEEIQKEVLRLMPGLVSLIGGPYHAHILLDIVFESLMKVGTAENSVKETAVNVAKDLFRGIDLRHFQKLLMDFIDRGKQAQGDVSVPTFTLSMLAW